MVLKLTINLPNQVAITVEASEAGLVREVVRLALRELPAELMQMHTSGGRPADGEANSPPGQQRPAPPASAEADQVPGDPAGRQELAQFCRRLDPMGDMRRVVVAAQGASAYLGLHSVSPRELGRLFDLAGWPRPGDFVQALRNAARSKFRWLQRVPGSPGYYSVTPKGQEVVMGDGPN